MKKKYIQPVIKRIKLDPDQAILTACVVGGVYFYGGAGATCLGPLTMGTPTIIASCGTSVRSAQGTDLTCFYSASAQPS